MADRGIGMIAQKGPQPQLALLPVAVEGIETDQRQPRLGIAGIERLGALRRRADLLRPAGSGQPPPKAWVHELERQCPPGLGVVRINRHRLLVGRARLAKGFH